MPTFKKSMYASRLKYTVLLFLLAVPFYLSNIPKSFAEQITNRGIVLSSNAVSASPVTHTVSFAYNSSSNIGSVVIEYCTNTPLIGQFCAIPAGLDTSAATLSAQSGETGFSIHPSTLLSQNKIIITRPASAVTPQQSSYAFGNITNPSAPMTYFVRVTTHASNDGTGAYTDYGGMAFHTADDYDVQAFVPPRLEFCVGVSIPTDCNSATGNLLSFGDFSTSSTASATSQFRANTNAGTGYNVTVVGTTMTSGNNFIPALANPSLSQSGTSQFGMNLRDNSSPDTGQNVSGPGPAVPDNDYNVANLFKFASNDTVAFSASTSDNDTFTATYIVNISNDQAPGIYSTTLSFICLASF
jgi:hypothetical protein